MTQEERNKYIKGNWYKDSHGEFIKFKQFDRDGNLDFTAYVRDGKCIYHESGWIQEVFPKCVPMSIKEMKKYLPEKEWWTENNNELFPMF